MTLQTIKSIDGKDEYVLLPVMIYKALKEEIEDELAGLEAATEKGEKYVPFLLDDYVDNPVALARMKAHITQKELAQRLSVTQAYVSKIERQEKITPKLLARVNAVLS
ncbi:MAG: helix-turn-helix domain-containing protein [Gammaproteobacteria bacterium]|nr:helix-turn-helix domain-containing protein [Gammaproteobacteria bacterium]MBU1978168.1 helix-turn-helix domain-containing protein [Gammaproteobacteria bacterium]